MTSARQSIHGSVNKFENGELGNRARQSIRGAPDSMVEDASTAPGNQCMGLRIRLEIGDLANSARQSIRGSPDSMLEDALTAPGNQFMGLRIRLRIENWGTALGNQFAGLQTRWWRTHQQR